MRPAQHRPCSPHDKWTAFVRIDVVRHDPLSGKADVASDLLTGRAAATTDPGADVIPLPDRTTVIPERSTTGTGGAPTTSDVPAARRGKTRTTTPTTAAVESDGPVAMGRSGEDVSDYV